MNAVLQILEVANPVKTPGGSKMVHQSQPLRLWTRRLRIAQVCDQDGGYIASRRLNTCKYISQEFVCRYSRGRKAPTGSRKRPLLRRGCLGSAHLGQVCQPQVGTQSVLVGEQMAEKKALLGSWHRS